jgi:hypothetical protein
LNLAASTNGDKTFVTSGDSFTDTFTIANNVSWRYEADVLMPILSTSGEQFVYTTGINNTTNTVSAISNGCYFRYGETAGNGSGKWQGVCEDGTESTCDTTITVVVDTWYRLTMVINSAGNSVDFRVNGVSKCTITTHIPSSTALVSFESIINKTNGNGLRGVYFDYLAVRAQFTTAR